MLNTILIDSGSLIALFDRDDYYHNSILEFISKRKFRFVTTIAVLTEVTHMLDFSVDAQLLFFNWILNEGAIIHNIDQSDIVRVIELTKKYSDRPMDFADATLVITAERTGINKIISIDSDFDIYRLAGKAMIENVYQKSG